jgi:hypothetical protein
MQLPAPTPLVAGTSLVVGREGELKIGADPLDTRVSRRAVVIDVGDGEWKLRVLNTNGAVIHPWGLRAFPATAAPEQSGHLESLRWPRIGVRVLGGEDLIHWVLAAAPIRTPAPTSPPAMARTSHQHRSP